MALADELNMSLAMDKCEVYIGLQVMKYCVCLYVSDAVNREMSAGGSSQSQYKTKQELIDMFTLYLLMCDKYRLKQHIIRTSIRPMLVDFCVGYKDLSSSAHYANLSLEMKNVLLTDMCKRLEQRLSE
jgi:hypothetical protein